jgi:alkylation response protein AidB-like acyl-CoA dehydrogenase
VTGQHPGRAGDRRRKGDVDFERSDEQVEYCRQIERFARERLCDDVVGRDRSMTFARDLWRALGEFGFLGLPVPAELGGSGADALTTVLAFEALGAGCPDNGLIFSIGAHLWSGVMPLVRFGSPAQQARWLPGLCDGTLIAVQGMTEPDTGSDAFALRTAAVRDGDDWVLDGAKTFITNAPIADVFVIFASTAPERGAFGISAFLVEGDAPGLVVGRPFEKMGLRTSPMSELAFSGCRVPATALLGRLGNGMAIFNHSIHWERACIMASAVGTMRRQLERSIEHARSRTQFGQPIGKFQAVSHRIVDMKLRLETCRLLLYRTAASIGSGRIDPMDAALVKLHVSESLLQSSLDTVQIHGALGYMTETEVERDVRDAVASRLYSGTSEIQRNIVAQHLGL